jgi:hypothetical protein
MPPKNGIEHVPNTCLERCLQSSMFSNLNLKCSCLKSWKVPATRMHSPVFGQHTRLVRCISYAYLPQLAQSEASPTCLCLEQILPHLGNVFA